MHAHALANLRYPHTLSTLTLEGALTRPLASRQHRFFAPFQDYMLLFWDGGTMDTVGVKYFFRLVDSSALEVGILCHQLLSAASSCHQLPCTVRTYERRGATSMEQPAWSNHHACNICNRQSPSAVDNRR